jgi:hypothetical protein
VKRLSLLAVPLLLIGLLMGLLAGCGSDSSSTAASDEPTTAASSDADDQAQKVTAFCNVIVSIASQSTQTKSDSEALKLLKKVGAEFDQIGAPDDMPEDAQRALQLAIDKIKAIPDDATADEVAKAAGDLTAGQKKDQAALGEYVQEKCLAPAQSSTTPSPSDSSGG